MNDPSLGFHVASLAAGKMPSVQALVDHYAPQFNIDPVAAMQVSQVEGGGKWGAVGDQGTSYGPWQLHQGGALPAQYATPGAASAFANSPEGVKYVLSRMAKAGAAGLTGKAAVAAIVRGFERPADPEGEIAKAMGMTGMGVSAPGGLGAPPAVSTWKSSTLPGFSASLTKDIAALGGESDPGLALLNQTLASQRAFSKSYFKPMPSVVQPGSPVGTPVIPTGSTGIAKTALTQVGIPYQWGGAAKLGSSTDCSGLLQASARANGIDLPRTTYEQFKVGQAVPLGQLQPGDAVFSHPTPQGPGHVSIYIGNGKLVEDPHTGASVSVSDLAGRKGIIGARRYG